MADQDIEMQEEPSTSAAALHNVVLQDITIFGAPCGFNKFQLPTHGDILRRVFSHTIWNSLPKKPGHH